MKQHTRWAFLRISFLLISLGIVAGCIPKPQPDLTNPVRTVAILPFANMSNNVDAPQVVRENLSQQMTAKFYRVLPLEQIDQTLADDLGITLGEQLEDVEMREIASKINADAFIFGHITHFESTLAGVVNTNRVAAKMRMVQVGTQTELWGSHIGAKSTTASGGIGGLMALGSDLADASDEEIQWITVQSDQNNNGGGLLGGLIAGLAEKAINSAFGVDMQKETQAMVSHSLATMRNGPGS
jgi:hypothetical protein